MIDVSRGLRGGFRLTFETEEDIRKAIEPLQTAPLRLTVKKWTQRRSRNANAYYYVLLGRIAEKARMSITEAHNRTIADYGQPSGMAVLLRDGINWQTLEEMHLKPTPELEVVDGDLYRHYLVMRGSHTYDTAEMAALIEGTISDAKDLGIETLTPAELEEMMRAYEINHRKKRD